jgi:SulP family sulfate permease
MLHGVISALVVMLVLLFFTSLLFHLPFSVLSSVIFLALKSLLSKIREPLRLWRTNRPDAFVWLVTFFVTLFLEIMWGLVVGVAVSTVILLQSVSRPSVAVLQRLPEFPWVYRNPIRFPASKPVSGILILRFSAPLHFANRDFFQAWIRKSLIERQRADEFSLDSVNGTEGDGGVRRTVDVRYIILDCSSVTSVDSSAFDMLTRLNKDLQEQNIQVCTVCLTNYIILFSLHLMFWCIANWQRQQRRIKRDFTSSL